MKHPKPGFKVFIKTRIRHPFSSNTELIYIDAAGARYTDIGSYHTVLIPLTIIIFFVFTVFTLNYTIYGKALFVLPLLLHRFFRYFWTDFAMLDEEGNEIEDTSLLYEKKKSRLPGIIQRGLSAGGLYGDEEETKYSRYSGRQKALYVLETFLVIAVLASVLILLNDSNYSFIHKPYEGKEHIEQRVDTLAGAYELSRSHADEVCPEAMLVDYGTETRKDGTSAYCFVFRNPMRGLFINRAVNTIIVFINYSEDYMEYGHYKFVTPFSRFDPVNEPVKEVNIKKIIDIVIQEAGLDAGSVDSTSVATHFWKYDSPNLTDPGGNTWAVEIRADGGNYYFTVDLAKGTAIREERYYEVS